MCDLLKLVLDGRHVECLDLLIGSRRVGVEKWRNVRVLFRLWDRCLKTKASLKGGEAFSNGERT